MDGEAILALQRFMDVPAIVEALQPSALARNALVATRNAQVGGFTPEARRFLRVRVPPEVGAPSLDGSGAHGFARAVARPPATPPTVATGREPTALEPARPDDYQAMLKSVGDRIAREVPKVDGYGIALFNGAAKDVETEVHRILPIPRTVSGFRKVYSEQGGAGGFAMPVDVGPGSARCLVVSLRPETTIATMVPPVGDGDPSIGTMTAAEWQKILTYHEVGHCLVGGSESRADTFGVLMAIQEGISKDAAVAFANIRETGDFINPFPNDEHASFGSIETVVRQYDALRADPEFMKLDILGVASLAKAMADRHVPGPRAFNDIADVRRMTMAAFMQGAYWVRSADKGGMVSTDLRGWLHAHRAESPVFERLIDIDARLHDLTRVPTAFKLDRDQFVHAVDALAGKGDPTARAMMQSLRQATPVTMKPDTMPKAYKLDNGQRLAGKFIALDDGMPSARFSDDATQVAVRKDDGTLAIHDVASGASRETDPVAELGLRR